MGWEADWQVLETMLGKLPFIGVTSFDDNVPHSGHYERSPVT